MSLFPLVQLYERVEQSASIENGVFKAKVPGEKDVIELIQEVSRDGGLGRFRDVEIDGEDYTDDLLNEFPKKSSIIEFEFVLSSSDAGRFYNDFDDFISSNLSISHGDIPDDFYLIEEKCYSQRDIDCSYILSLNKFKDFVFCLSSLAHYHDSKNSDDFLKLVFIHPEDSGGKRAVEIVVKVSSDTIQKVEKLDLSLLHSLTSVDKKTDVHYFEKLNIFSNSLIEVVGKENEYEKKFSRLIESWDDFLETFGNNISTYMSGFAFHKVKREVAEAEIFLSESLSKLLSDITTRVLSIPLSFVAIVGILKTDSFWEAYFIVVGVLVASIIISQSVAHQQLQFKRVAMSRLLIMNSFVGKESQYPEDLNIHIKNMAEDLIRNEKKVRYLLRFFRVVSWLPALLSLFVFLFVYTDYLG